MFRKTREFSPGDPLGAGGSGFSLVELLVAILVTAIVTGVAFSLYRSTSSHYYREEAYILQQQNLRAATFILSRDIRASGNGIDVVGSGTALIQAITPSKPVLLGTGQTTFDTSGGLFHHPGVASPGKSFYGVMPIFGNDGGANHSDSLTIFKSEIEYPTSLGQIVGYDTGGGSPRLLLDKTIKPGTVDKGDILMIVGSEGAVLVESNTGVPLGSPIVTIEVAFKRPGRFVDTTYDSDYHLNSVTTIVGSKLYNVRDVAFVTYYVDEAENRLMAAHHDQKFTDYDDPTAASVTVAQNIEDLQFYYYFGDDELDLSLVSGPPDIGFEEFREKTVNAIAIGITSRAGHGTGPKTNYRPALFNRSGGTVADNRRRSSFLQLVSLRN
ncbi:MAG: hypothetical protein LBF41_10465 [Deltaproteobacteria bacterium]|jgi:hypothetical protein|nr:hypothetical protein [Deltaproteobacteria bacterium]